jgi:hypothetical protein
MIDITLLSPNIITFDTTEGIVGKFSHQMFTDTKLGVNLPVNFSLIMNLTEKSADGRFVLPIDGFAMFSESSAKTLHEIKSTIGQCSQIAEILFGKLKQVNNTFKENTLLNDIFEKYEERYHKLDFMGHRNLLSDILKSNKIEWLREVLKEYNCKSVTKSFYNFILDRNKYTHGELMFWYPEMKTILEYESDNKQVQYGEVNKDILNSFLICYKTIDEFLNDIERNRK